MIALVAVLALVATQEPVAAPTPSSARAQRIAVAEIGGDVDVRLRQVFTESLLLELRKLQRTSVIGMTEVRAMLEFEATRQLAGCTDDAGCLAEIADALGVDAVVAGDVVKVGTQTVVSLKRLDQKTASVGAQYQARLESHDGEEVLAAIGPAVAELYPDVPLRDGATRGVSAEQALRLNPPPLPPFAAWATAGSSVVAGATAVSLGVAWGVAQGAHRDRIANAQETTTSGKDIKASGEQVVALETAMWAATATSAALVAAALVMVPFVDWAEPPAPSSSTSP